MSASISGGVGVDPDDDPDDLPEPPVPPGLAKLSGALRTLADFLRVDDELIQVAAAESAGDAPAEPARVELARWVQKLPAADKDAYLLRFLAEEGDCALRAELSQRFRVATAPQSAAPAPARASRTASQLFAARDALIEEKTQKAAARAAKERSRLERERAEARTKYLNDLARRESAAWSEVDALIATKQPKNYDRAVTLLVDLNDLAVRSGRALATQQRIRDLRARHSSKSSLRKRLDDKKLPR